MGIGFTTKDPELEEERVSLYRTVIECTACGDDELYDLYEGTCSCGNVEIGVHESICMVRHKPKSNWTHWKTIRYKDERPRIYEVLREDKKAYT